MSNDETYKRLFTVTVKDVHTFAVCIEAESKEDALLATQKYLREMQDCPPSEFSYRTNTSEWEVIPLQPEDDNG